MMSASRMEEAEDASVYEAEISVNETLRRKIALQRENFIFGYNNATRYFGAYRLCWTWELILEIIDNELAGAIDCHRIL